MGSEDSQRAFAEAFDQVLSGLEPRECFEGESYLIANQVSEFSIELYCDPGSRRNGSYSPWLSDANDPTSVSISLTTIPCLVQKLGHLQAWPDP